MTLSGLLISPIVGELATVGRRRGGRMTSDGPRWVAHGGGFALGTFSRAGGSARFPGLVVGDRVLDLSPAASTRDLLADWDAALPALSARAGDPAGEWLEPAELLVHAPGEPRQGVPAGVEYPTPGI